MRKKITVEVEIRPFDKIYCGSACMFLDSDDNFCSLFPQDLKWDANEARYFRCNKCLKAESETTNG